MDDSAKASLDSCDDYLLAMKRVQQQFQSKHTVHVEIMSPRDRHRQTVSQSQGMTDGVTGNWSSVQQATRISTVASLVPDEIIYKHSDLSVRTYETALMFIDVSGYTELCESYTKPGRGGPSRLTEVLNSYIGAMVQEILMHNGDVLKFSGDAFLSMWKKTPSLSMQDVVHTAIDCGLIIQKNYGTFVTDVGVVLKVKVAISAGLSHFSIIGGGNTSQSHYVIVGPPVWDVKMAEYMSTAGDVLTSASAWIYVNEAEYCTQPCGDGRHTKVIGVGATWKRVESVPPTIGENQRVRPAVVSALRSSWWPALRRFMVTPVLRAVDNDEPMDFLTEIRRVVVVFLNIITKTVTEDVLIELVDAAYKKVCSVTSASGGLVNKVSMFDKDMMFLVVFGLRGLKQEDEAQMALQCAHQLKETLVEDNIISISIGVTSGTTYCGVVGHNLRREYTVIGPAVNKAARLMMAFPMRVTCDKETFLRSKLDQEHFRMMEPKVLKGIAKPGPIYEFNKIGWSERPGQCRHPILGRSDELRKYTLTLQIALNEHDKTFTRYKDHKFGFAIIGPTFVGKTRFMEECINITPSDVQTDMFMLSEKDEGQFYVFRKIMARAFIATDGYGRSDRERVEKIIRYSIDVCSLTPVQLYALNTIFDIRFPLPENFVYTGDILNNFSVKNLLQEIFKTNFSRLWVVALKEAQYMDDQSWRMMLILLEIKVIFLLMTLTDTEKLSPVAGKCLENYMIVKQHLTGIDRWYHAALACQLLDVQAIPADLEKVVESASGGMPGWIQNFVISLVQRGVLSVVTVSRSEAIESGAVIPSPALLQRPGQDLNSSLDPSGKRQSHQSTYSAMITASMASVHMLSKQDSQFRVTARDAVQMAVLCEGYSFDDMTADMTMDAVILKTYDSLTPFEKMILKCGSVLGDVFSRRMLLHLLQSDSPRKVAQAVEKLFLIRVLECEGGDFTRDTSLVLVHPAPALPEVTPPFCACLGIRQAPNCRDLPLYAFCGYMKFRHSLFRTTTYELLTENQKTEMHARALLFLERYTRRCMSCGMGCFTKLLGKRNDDGLIPESEDVKRTKQQIRDLSAETRMAGEEEHTYSHYEQHGVPELAAMTEGTSIYTNLSSYDLYDAEARRNYNVSLLRSAKDKHRVRSFSSLVIAACECLSILTSVYSQMIDHCRGAGEYEKLYEAFMEYADVSIINLNIPQAVRLLFEVEVFVKSDKIRHKKCKSSWMKDFRLANVYTLRGVCMLESGDLNEAKKQLLHAMKLYYDPFPTSKHAVRLRNMTASMKQLMGLYVVPHFYVGIDRGIVGYFYEDISRTLSLLYRLFSETKELGNASLAAKLSLSYALRTNSNFRVLCIAYGNMITTYRQNHRFSLCVKLEKRVSELCHRKSGQLDVFEVHAVCYLYTSIFLFYVEHGKKEESLDFGLSVMHMMSSLTDLTTRQMLILWMLKLLLSDLRIHDMVSIMREFFYMNDHYDLSSETWYYYYSMVIMLDTGYCVESYFTCERFYIKKGDAILRSKTPEAAWNFFVCMWLVTTRIGAWERAIMWEEKIRQILSMKFEKHEFNIMILVRLVEGLLITLVKEMDNRNIKKIFLLDKAVKGIFRDMHATCRHTPMYLPRYYLLYAYFHYVKGNKVQGYNLLNQAMELSKQLPHGTLLIWTEHTRNHWRGTLNPRYEDYWADHIEPDNLLDYRDFDGQKSTIVPYTLPLPRDLEDTTP
ncbi:hypothetical protein ABMA27_005935 [Loxostege sticticalis]|uniref:Guanylate cyclase domain-containing protein n=1 Tax=Loxostege sticticalis TaxID=481309 RepID=A0ABR3HGZ7_LOXSC